MEKTNTTEVRSGRTSETDAEEVITTHINADFDALASMVAAKKLYPRATLSFPGAQEKSLRNFFLHSSSYLFNFTKIKHIDLEKIKRLIIVDTRQKGRIGKFAEIVDKKGIEIHIYDHHPESQDDIRGDLEIIRKTGSNTTILTEIIKSKGLKILPYEATIMCLGIHEDTGSFTFSSTTSADYMAAAWLTEKGADHNVIANMLTREMTAEQVWLLNDITKSATTMVINGLEVVISKVIRDEYIGDLAVLVHKFMDMENLNAVFVIAQMADRAYLIARSRTDNLNVAEIARAFGGGGHPYAASATIKNKTIVQIEKMLTDLLKDHINADKYARDVMSAPVIKVYTDNTIKDAERLITRYNINVLIVTDRADRIKGYITRQVIEKAMFFGLKNIKVSDYMNIEFVTVSPDASLKEVEDLVVRNRLRVLPVVQDDRIAGVITRTDILNILIGKPLLPETLYDSRPSSQFKRQKDMAAILKKQLPERIFVFLQQVGAIADSLKYNAYLVGGPVRDVLLNRNNMDVDIVIEGDGIRFARTFAKYHDVRVTTHSKFRTAVLVFPDGFKVDVATARMEYYESPGALPIVETSSLKLDLMRRDFTINTLAIKLNAKDFGVLIDYFGGQRDIREKVLRVLHNLSFVEDPTRVFRAVRFEQRFNFKIGKFTLALIKNAVRINAFRNIDSKRLYNELILILKEHDPVTAIERMAQLDLLSFVLPDIEFTEELKSVLLEIRKTIAWHNLLYREDPCSPWKVYWYGLTDSCSISALQDLTGKLGLGDKETKKIIAQRENRDSLVAQLERPGIDNYMVYKLLETFDTEFLLYLMAKVEKDSTKRLISNYFTKLKDVKLHITGKDLISIGLKPGPQFGKIFQKVLEAKLNNEIETWEDEINFVKERLQAFNQ